MTRTANELGSYGQLCPIAVGTDAVGDRWTLLLLRDLAQTPLRFSELEASNPGISPSVLTKRLARLEDDGVIETVTAGRTGQKRYQLTASARPGVLEVLAAVARLGRALAPEGPVTAEQLVHQFSSDRPWFLAKHHRTEGTFEMRVDDAVIGLEVDQFTFEPTIGPPENPTAVITIPSAVLMEITSAGLTLDDAIGSGRASVEGDIGAVRSLLASLAASYLRAS